VTATSDIPSLTFVDPDTVDPRWRIGLFGPPGAGKTVAATSAPGPILAVNADRPGAYRYSRVHHKGTLIHEVRFTGWPVMRDVYEYARANQGDIGTVVMDPVNNVYEHLVRENTGPGGKPAWQKVNETFSDLIRAFRALDVNLVLVAHERVEKDENADTEAKVYPNYGGPSLIQKVMAELDIVARVFRRPASEDEPEGFVGQLVTARGYQCKDSSGRLGRVRVADLSEWIATANADDEEPVPWDEDAAVEAVQEAFDAVDDEDETVDPSVAS
jgi:hypothetical protein